MVDKDTIEVFLGNIRSCNPSLYISVSCGSVVNNTLKSPANPDGVYAVSMNCIYNVSIPYGRVMRLKFQIFDLESDSGCR